MMKRTIAMLLCLCMALLCTTALATEASPTPQALTLTDQTIPWTHGTVSWPQVTGLADETLQAQVNARLMEAGQTEARLTSLYSQQEGSIGVNTSWTAVLRGDVLSVCFSATGALHDGRFTHEWDAVTIDLTTGEDVPFSALFTSESAARAFLEDYLETQVAPELSGYLERGEVTPLPEKWCLTDEGLMLCYDPAAFLLLSGYTGSVTVLYSELRDLLDLSEGSILSRLGAADSFTLNAGSAEKIAAAVSAGQLPGVPVVVGASLQAAIDDYRMLIDPDYYTGGRFFQLEDGAFRGVRLLTDALTDGWTESVIQGVRADRAAFFGLCPGLTTRTDYLAVLGEPAASVALDAETADAYDLPEGTSDYYNYGANQLRLHTDAQGVLSALFITQ